jgi:hypothetical protein
MITAYKKYMAAVRKLNRINRSTTGYIPSRWNHAEYLVDLTKGRFINSLGDIKSLHKAQCGAKKKCPWTGYTIFPSRK